MVTLGEVHTGLLQNSNALLPRDTVRILSLLPGTRVRRWERPIAHAVSPNLLTGVDCALPSRRGARSRAVGTAVSRAMITGGHVVQGSTFLQVVAGASTRRLPWSHYLSRPGTAETIGRVNRDDVVGGFVTVGPSPAALDLGAISARLLDAVQRSEGLDRRPPFRAARTRLRWIASSDATGGTEPEVQFTVDDEYRRTVRVCTADRLDQPDRLERMARLAEDLALHDWLLTTLLRVVERARISAEPDIRVVQRLRPAIDHLLHLWMPAARLDGVLAALWEGLERHPGFTRQWNACVARIRDQVAVAAVTLFASTVRSGSAPGNGPAGGTASRGGVGEATSAGGGAASG